MADPKLDLETLQRAVEALWHGLEEDARSGLSAVRIDARSGTGSAESAHLAYVEPAAMEDEKPVLVVSFATIEARIESSDAPYPWRAELARAFRREASGTVRTTVPPSVAVPGRTPGPPVDAPGRMSYAEFSVALDPFGGGTPGSVPPEGDPRSTVPPTSVPPAGPESAPEWAAGVSSRLSRVPSGEWSAPPAPSPGRLGCLAAPFRLALAPARAALRKQRADSVIAGVRIWAFRLVTLACYLAIVGGMGYLVWFCAATWRAGEGDGPALEGGVAEDGAERAPMGGVEERRIRGAVWLVPLGWTAQAGESDVLVRMTNPEGAVVEVLEVDLPTGAAFEERARLCVGEREARVAAGGGDPPYIEARYEEGGDPFHVRCLFQQGHMVRASATWIQFDQADLDEWALVAALAARWRSTAGGDDG